MNKIRPAIKTIYNNKKVLIHSRILIKILKKILLVLMRNNMDIIRILIKIIFL
jgi:hypothetical protein